VSGLSGAEHAELTSDDCYVYHASISPSKEHIAAVIGDVDIHKVERHLFVMDRDGKNRRLLTSGTIIVDRSRWSFDGKWLAYSVRSASFPGDSTDIYLIQPFSPSAPRRLCRGRDAEWIDKENIAVWTGAKTLQYSIKGGAPFQLYEDSTFAVPMRIGKQLLFQDFRNGREGIWRADARADGKQAEAPAFLARLPEFMEHAIPVGGEFVLYRMHGTEPLWRVQTSTGRAEVVGKASSVTAWMNDVSVDGEQVLWIKESYPAKVVMLEDVLEGR
jgi:hypothetical protein